MLCSPSLSEGQFNPRDYCYFDKVFSSRNNLQSGWLTTLIRTKDLCLCDLSFHCKRAWFTNNSFQNSGKLYVDLHCYLLNNRHSYSVTRTGFGCLYMAHVSQNLFIERYSNIEVSVGLIYRIRGHPLNLASSVIAMHQVRCSWVRCIDLGLNNR